MASAAALRRTQAITGQIVAAPTAAFDHIPVR